MVSNPGQARCFVSLFCRKRTNHRAHFQDATKRFSRATNRGRYPKFALKRLSLLLHNFSLSLPLSSNTKSRSATTDFDKTTRTHKQNYEINSITHNVLRQIVKNSNIYTI